MLAVQMTPAVCKEGPEVIQKMPDEINHWLKSRSISSIAEICGKLKQSERVKPLVCERARFMKYFADARQDTVKLKYYSKRGIIFQQKPQHPIFPNTLKNLQGVLILPLFIQ